ncbi:MAG: hypothetical protein KDD60_11445 [Bdellovibrionales bacterium]|nr:hypothetical protein [Bdellovibrionales bacterium]
MLGCIWGGNNIDPRTWVQLFLIQLASEGQTNLKKSLIKPATLADAVDKLTGQGVEADISTLSRMGRITDCHARLSDKMKLIRSAIISSLSLETCFLYFEEKLLSTMMFSISGGDLSHHSKSLKALNGLYRANRYSLRGKRRVTQSAFLFYRNEKNVEPLSGYAEIESGMYAKDALSEVHRYRELRKITPVDDVPFFIHTRGFVFLLNDGFYLVGTSLETTSAAVTSKLALSDIRRSQIEHEFLEDDRNPAVVRGIKTGFLRGPAHPVSSIIHMRRVGEGHVSDWDNVSKKIQIGTLPDEQFNEHDLLKFEQDLSTGMLTVRTL